MPAQPAPPFFQRLSLAFQTVFDEKFAAAVAALRARPAPPPALPSKERQTLPANAAQLSRCEQALHLLSLFQREGQLIDFCHQDFDDAAARMAHGGCRKVLLQSFTMEPVRREPQGSAVSIPGGFNPGQIRLTGNVMGNPPFKGVLRHHGWKVTQIKMPPPSGDPTILAPARVDLP